MPPRSFAVNAVRAGKSIRESCCDAMILELLQRRGTQTPTLEFLFEHARNSHPIAPQTFAQRCRFAGMSGLVAPIDRNELQVPD